MKTRHRVGAHLLDDLLRALPVDVEHHVLAAGEGLLDGLPRRAVIIAVHLRPFEKVAAIPHLLEIGDALDEDVMHARRSRTGASAGSSRRSTAGSPGPPGRDCGSGSTFRRRTARRGSAGVRAASMTAATLGPLLHVLNLLAELLDHRLEVEADPRQRDVVGLGAERVGLAAEFLRQEIEPAPDRAARREELAGAAARGRAGDRAPRGYRPGRRSARPPGAAAPGRAPAPASRMPAICASSLARIASGWRAGDASASPTRRGDRVELAGAGSSPGPRLRLSRASLRLAMRRPIAPRRSRGEGRILPGLGPVLVDLDDAANGEETVEGRGLDRRRQVDARERLDQALQDVLVDPDAAAPAPRARVRPSWPCPRLRSFRICPRASSPIASRPSGVRNAHLEAAPVDRLESPTPTGRAGGPRLAREAGHTRNGHEGAPSASKRGATIMRATPGDNSPEPRNGSDFRERNRCRLRDLGRSRLAQHRDVLRRVQVEGLVLERVPRGALAGVEAPRTPGACASAGGKRLVLRDARTCRSRPARHR